MASAYVDANVVIALWHGPSHIDHDRALALFRRVADGDIKVTVTTPVLAEIVWYCERRLDWTRERITRAITLLLNADGVVPGEAIAHRAVALFSFHRNLDFVDAHVAATALESGPPVIASFDRGLDRVEGVTRIAS